MRAIAAGTGLGQLQLCAALMSQVGAGLCAMLCCSSGTAFFAKELWFSIVLTFLNGVFLGSLGYPQIRLLPGLTKQKILRFKHVRSTDIKINGTINA